MDWSSPETGAACALHPDAPAHAICARCGNFMCSTCDEGGATNACPRCRALAGEVPGLDANRDAVSLDAVVGFSWEVFKKQWVMLSAITLIYFVILFAIGLATQLGYVVGGAVHESLAIGLSVVSSVVQAIAQAVLTGGLVVVIYDVMRGGTVDVGRLFGQFSKLTPYVVSTLWMFAVMAAFAVAAFAVFGIPGYYLFRDAEESTLALVAVGAGLVASVPAVWLLLPFMFPEMEIALGGADGSEAVRRSFQLAKGRRLWMVLVYVVSALFMFAGVLACCIGVVPAFALAQMLKVALYLVLRNGSGLPLMRPPAPA